MVIFALLCAGYVGYTFAFTVLVARLGSTRGVPILPTGPTLSRTAQETTDLARIAFGPAHWTVTAKLRYYESERGYWIFAKDYERKPNGKQWDFSPVAVILRSEKGGSLRSISGQRATIEFNRSLDLAKPGSAPARIVKARIVGDVQIRDDRSTPGDIADDLLIGPLTYLEFDDRAERIATESAVQLRDRTLEATGSGLTIDLSSRGRAATSGGAKFLGNFDGIRTVHVLRDIKIRAQDVGRSGMVPGAGRKVAQAETGEPTPGELVCDGPMRVDLPAPRIQPRVGPPSPPGPTHVFFSRNVRVRQGSPQAPDQLDTDQLHVVLVPDPAKTEPRAEQSKSPSSPMSGLVVQNAKASGHAVFLHSPTQGLDAQGNEMIYDRLGPERSRIYFRGDRKTVVKKSNYEQKQGKRGDLQSVDTIETVDVTIFQETAGASASIVARGPGRLETRSARDQQLERAASWKDKLIMQPVESGDRPRRQITLLGEPSVESKGQGKLSAFESIIARLRPKLVLPLGPANSGIPGSQPVAPKGPSGEKLANAAEQAQAQAQAQADRMSAAAGDGYVIEWATARGNVVLEASGANGLAGQPAATGQKTDAMRGPKRLTAQDQLDVEFVEEPYTVPAEPEEPFRAARPAEPPQPADSDPAAPGGETLKPNANPTETSPALEVSAGYVWASVASRGTPERSIMAIKEVRLRRHVRVHQDPRPNGQRGLDAHAEELDLRLLDGGLARVDARGKQDALARVASDGIDLEGQTISLDQPRGIARVEGTGKLTSQRAGRTIAAPNPPPAPAGKAQPDDGRAQPAERPEAAEPKGPLVVTWSRGMELFSQHIDARGGGKAVFHGSPESPVTARTDDGSMIGNQLEILFDRAIPFQQAAARQAAAADGNPEAEKDPQIVEARVTGGVSIESLKLEPGTRAIQERRVIQGESAIYRRETGEFDVPGQGLVRIYRPRGSSGELGNMAMKRSVAPVSNPNAPGNTGRKATNQVGVELLRISFQKSMRGRFDALEPTRPEAAPKPAEEQSGAKRPPTGIAQFQGDVQAALAPVADWQADFDPDEPPLGARSLVSQKLKVISEAAPKGASEASRILVDALENPVAFDETKSLKGDRITYDSMNGLFYVYGYDNEVMITEQSGAGQPFSSARGTLIRYNTKDGAMQLLDPKTFAIIDPGSGRRAVTAKEPQPKPDRKPPRTLRPIPQGDRERAGFGGR